MSEDEVRATEVERLRALVDCDIERARELHADDFQLINPGGGALTREEYLGLVSSGQMRYVSWEPEEIVVRLHGDAAVLRYRAELSFGPGTTLRCWHTDTYERRSGRWQAVWSQATIIQ
jgi:hypothetical protein